MSFYVVFGIVFGLGAVVSAAVYAPTWAESRHRALEGFSSGLIVSFLAGVALAMLYEAL